MHDAHMFTIKLHPESCDVCRRSRGFGFIEYRDPRDADDAMYKMDGSNIGGRDITVSLPVLVHLLDMFVITMMPHND